MPLLRFTILIIFGVVASQNHGVNSQIPYKRMTRQGSVEPSTPIPPDPKIDDAIIEKLVTRLESLCIEKLEFLITDTNERFQSLESKSTQVHSTVDIIGEKLDNLTMEVGRMSQCCSGPATPVVLINETLEVKVETLSKEIQLLMDATKNLSSNVETVKQNVSSLINDTRSIFNQGLQEQKILQTAISTSNPLNFTLNKPYPKNCREVQESGTNASGIYTIQPEHSPKPFDAVCDLETRGGNWTVIQRRYDGSQDFYLGWDDYKNGFGNLTGEFWLGFENIHLLTGYEWNELLIEIGDFEFQNASAFYSQFTIGSEIEGYSLNHLGEYSGNASESLSYSVGSRFYTKDLDPTGSAKSQDTGWWFTRSGGTRSNLNGRYLKPGDRGELPIYWYFYKDSYTNLKHTRMLVKPKV